MKATRQYADNATADLAGGVSHASGLAEWPASIEGAINAVLRKLIKLRTLKVRP